MAFTIHRNTYTSMQPLSLDHARRELERARQWWEMESDLPRDVIQVPDPGIQEMLDSCIRNIWQSRDIINDLPAFHVGPTKYRMLWIVDGAFMLETAAMLGRAQDARAGIDYMLEFQEDDGGFQLKKRYWKEGGLVIWTLMRHAMITGDKQWLQERWSALEDTVAWIQQLRTRESAADPNSPSYRLLPWGDIDGGINNTLPHERKGEYSNIYWALIGIKSAVTAANWLGLDAQAESWQREYEDFYSAFRKAAKRDIKDDGHGNRYLPIIMEDALKALPQRAQWSFCHAVYPGQLFEQDDPIVQGTLAMLQETEVQGLVFDTGWMKGGIWTYFASFYGHALLWQGQGDEAARILYNFANHASPTRVWREEQKPAGRGGEIFGDMPHNWASAEFIRLTAHLLALDRGRELHLLEGMPSQWLQPGMQTRINGLGTQFGPLYMTLSVDEYGERAMLDVEPLRDSDASVVVHLPAGGTRALPATKGFSMELDIGPN